jgi:hypothetical protein
MIHDWQREVADRLGSDGYFEDIPVFTERKRDLESEVERALGTLKSKGGKMGLAVIVQGVVGSDKMSNVVAVHLSLELSVLVLEDVKLNGGAEGTGKSCLDVAVRVMEVLKLYQAYGLGSPLMPLDPALVPTGDFAPRIGYQVRFGVEDGGRVATRVLPPRVVPNGGAAGPVRMYCDSALAQIYYTLDGSYPGPGNEDAVLYEGVAVDVEEGQVVRVGAVADGAMPSDVIMARF